MTTKLSPCSIHTHISLLRFYLSFSREFLQTGLRKKQQSMLAKEIIVFFNACNLEKKTKSIDVFLFLLLFPFS